MAVWSSKFRTTPRVASPYSFLLGLSFGISLSTFIGPFLTVGLPLKSLNKFLVAESIGCFFLTGAIFCDEDIPMLLSTLLKKFTIPGLARGVGTPVLEGFGVVPLSEFADGVLV